MKDAEILKTDFSTMNGKYEFLRLLFGLKNTPAIFLSMIDDILIEYIVRICHVFIDDIIAFGKDEEKHLRNVYTIFGRLSKAKLKVNLEKTKFMENNVEFLGYIITPEGIKPDMKKVKT